MRRVKKSINYVLKGLAHFEMQCYNSTVLIQRCDY